MFDGPEPIYLQIAASIRAQILSGDLIEGEQVLSTTQFAAQFGINPATANKAFAGLVSEGLLEKRRGLGMFVTIGAREKLTKAHRQDYFAKVLRPALQEATLLGISTDEIVEYITMEKAAIVAHTPERELAAHPKSKVGARV